LFEYRGKTLPRSPELLIRILGLPVKENLRIEEALTHRSASHERGRKNPVPNYERLEFLGDRVIGLIVSEYLLNTWPTANEGDIGQIFSSIVSTQVLASIARRMDLGAFMILGKGSHSSGDRDNPSILADTLESLTACLYLEYGLETVRQILIPWFAQPLREIIIGLEQANVVKEARDSKEKKEPEVIVSPVVAPRRPPSLNYKMLVQKWCQRTHGVQPEYRVIEEFGPPHQRRFRVGAFVGEELLASGETTTKRGASILAAKNAWETVSGKEPSSGKPQDAVLAESPAGEESEVQESPVEPEKMDAPSGDSHLLNHNDFVSGEGETFSLEEETKKRPEEPSSVSVHPDRDSRVDQDGADEPRGPLPEDRGIALS
jgi:ribonuclease-3